jgi:hypothetical protein
MPPRMDVAWFDIRNHPFGLVPPNPAQPDQGGSDRRVILTKPFDGPCIAAMILGLSPETRRGIQTYEHGPNSRSFEGSTSK